MVKPTIKLYRGLSSDEFNFATDEVFEENKRAWASIIARRAKSDFKYPQDLLCQRVNPRKAQQTVEVEDCEKEMKIAPLDTSTWNDFVSLMKTDSQCSECWCLNHREPAGCAVGAAAQEKMKSLVSLGKVHGLLVYENKECTGWVAIDPMSELVGHDCRKTGKNQEWSIHCLFVQKGFRGQGVSTQLILAATEYAKANGAKLISAFPIPSESRNRFPIDDAEFSGRFSTYVKLGFSPVGEPSEFYQRVELDVDRKK